MALAAIEPYPVNIALQLPAIDVQIAGTIDDLTGAQILDLRLLARSASLRDALEAWNLTVPFDLEVAAEASVVGEFAELSLADVSARIVGIGGDRLTLDGGSIDVWEGTGLEGRLVAKLDPMGGIMRFLPERWRIAEGADVAASLSGSIAAPALEDLSAEIRGPGDSSVSLSGYVRASTGQQVQLEALDITAALAVPDPSTLADQLGVNPLGLGPWRGEGRLVLADRQFAVIRDEVRRHRISGRSVLNRAVRSGSRVSTTCFVSRPTSPSISICQRAVPRCGSSMWTCPSSARSRRPAAFSWMNRDTGLATSTLILAPLRLWRPTCAGVSDHWSPRMPGATELDLAVTLGWSFEPDPGRVHWTGSARTGPGGRAIRTCRYVRRLCACMMRRCRRGVTPASSYRHREMWLTFGHRGRSQLKALRWILKSRRRQCPT